MSGRNVTEIIERVVRDQFSSGLIRSVEVNDKFDEDGGRVLKIVIVLNKDFNNEDKKRILGLTRHIRSELYNIKMTDFPVIDFVSSNDAAKMKREFA
jgi:hypothetical protein